MKHYLPIILLCASSAVLADKTFEINTPLPPTGNRPGVVTELRLNSPSTPPQTPLGAAEPGAAPSPSLSPDSRPLIQAPSSGDESAVSSPAADSPNGGEGQPVRVFTSLEEAAAAGVNPLREEPAAAPAPTQRPEKSLLEKIVARVKANQSAVLTAVLVLLLGGATLLWYQRKSRSTSE